MSSEPLTAARAGPVVVLSADDLPALERFLAGRGWLAPDERVREAARAGEGNMNLTLRVRTTRRSVVVKQGRPWVEKYPTIAAPADRTVIEAEWYRLASRVGPVAARMPQPVGIDPESRVLLLTDIGVAGDYLYLYSGGRLGQAELDALVDWLLDLHGSFVGDPEAARLKNRAMRALNHEHIFEVPVRPGNGLELDAITPGLIALAGELRADTKLLDAIHRLGVRYLGEGATLLHGDYYPGSWLQADQPWIIDPEFGFYGPREFDLGVMLAHLRLAAQPSELAERTLARYRTGAPDTDVALAEGFAGVEVIRRLLGVSQLPVSFDLRGKRELIEHARAQVRAAP